MRVKTLLPIAILLSALTGNGNSVAQVYLRKKVFDFFLKICPKFRSETLPNLT